MTSKAELTQAEKDTIKANFERINADRLKAAAKSDPKAAAALRYYNAIKAGKARYKKALKINGKMVPTTFQKQIQQDAKTAGMSLAEYWQKNRRIIADFYVNGFITKKKKLNEVIKLAEQKDAAGYTLAINKVKKDLVKFTAEVSKADADLASSMNVGFILWKVNISDSRKIMTVNIPYDKIRKIKAMYKRKIKAQGNEL